MADEVLPSGASMHDITRFDGVHGRFESYVRELERLATAAQDAVEVLSDKPDPRAIEYVCRELRARMVAVLAASKVTSG